MDSSHGTSTSTGTGSGRRAANRHSRVQAHDEEEDYSSIMKNDVCEVVPRWEGKSVVTLDGFTR